MSRILFVYPNKEGYPIIPLGISVLSGILKHYGYKVGLFDVTFMVSERLDHNARLKTGVVKKVDMEKYWGKGEQGDIDTEFRKKIESFNPNLIAFSIVENNYGLARNLFKVAREVTNSPIIVGGIFPTVAPKFFVEDKNVDIICLGEGEYPILELANRLTQNRDISDISNLIVKKDGKLIKNSFYKYYDWEQFIYQDWEEFSGKHLFKPFTGKVWRTGFFEISRGCPFQCVYCANHVYQEIFRSLGKYHREKPIKYTIKEIAYMKKKYSLELIFFNDENFLMMSDKRFNKFCLSYKKEVDLPFYMQTRAETLLDEKRIKMLKDINCITIGIGVESGSEKIRKEVLNKPLPNEIYIKAFDNCHKYEIRTTANIMIGIPLETEDDILTSVEFCKRLKARSVGLSIFAPYHGSRLHDICVEHGFIEDRYYEDISVNYTTILNMPQLSKERIEELYYKFNSLVYG